MILLHVCGIYKKLPTYFSCGCSRHIYYYKTEEKSMTQEISQPTVNPLLQRLKIPGQTFRLPSHGIFYNNGELGPDVINGEVHVYPMTAYDEILLKTPDKLFSGEAVKEVFARCIPSIQKPLDLFTKDVDYLLVCLRLVTFGPNMEFKHTHSCKDAKRHEYRIDVRDLLKRTRSLDPTTATTMFTVVLPNEQKVHVQPLRFKDYVAISHSDVNNIETTEELFERTLTGLLSVIESVESDGETVRDRAFLKEWLQTISADYLRTITSKISESAEWGPSFNASVQCKDCEEAYQVEIPLNPVIFF